MLRNQQQRKIFEEFFRENFAKAENIHFLSVIISIYTQILQKVHWGNISDRKSITYQSNKQLYRLSI